jgi:uncharacterized membrane protein
MTTTPPTTTRRPLVSAGTVLGMGMGGFLDGIVFHQLLQTHNMLTARRPKDSIANIEINMFWDGLFHTATWLLTAVGLAMLWHAVRRRDVALSGRTFVGAMVMGWGIFNLVEGVIDHFLLNIHHLVQRLGQSVWDWVYVGSGVLLIVIGLMLIRGERPDAPEPLAA